MQNTIRDFWARGWQAIPISLQWRNGDKDARFPTNWRSIDSLDKAIDALEMMQTGNHAKINGVGIKTGPRPSGSGLFVIDVDGLFDETGNPCGNSAGFSHLRASGITDEFIKSTLVVRTPNGMHVICEWIDDLEMYRTTGSDVFEDNIKGKGVDIRGSGAVVFAPPSFYRRGNRTVSYEWMNKNPIRPLPQEFLKCLKKRNQALTDGELLREIRDKIGRPGYETWFRIAASTWRHLDKNTEKTSDFLSTIWPEEKPGEYKRLCESLKDYSGKPLTWGSVLRLARENGIDPGEESRTEYKTVKKEVPWSLHPYVVNDANTLTVEKAFQVPSLILVSSKSGYNKTIFSFIWGNQFSSMSVGEQLSPVLAQYHPARDVRTVLLECDMDMGMSLAYCQDLLLVPHGVRNWDGWVNKNFLVHRPTSEEMQSLDQIEIFIKQNKFELVIIDTLFSAFSLDYNKPQECRIWLKRLRALATACQCCIILLHHERKKSAAEKIAGIASDMDSVYGSVSLVAGIDACLSIKMDIISETERIYDITCLKPRIVFPNFKPVQARSEKKYTVPSEPLGPSYPYYDIKFTVEPKLPDPIVVRNVLVDLYKRETDRGEMPPIIRRSGISVAGFYRLLNILKEYDYIIEKSGGRWTRYIFTRKGLDIIEGKSVPDLIKNRATYEDRLFGEALFERSLALFNNRHSSTQTKTGFEHLAASAVMRYPKFMEIVKKDMIISSLLANKKAADTPFLCCCRSKMLDKPIEGLSQQDIREIGYCDRIQVSEQMFRDLLDVFKTSEDWLELTPSEFSHKLNNKELPVELPKAKDATSEIIMDISTTIPLDL